LAIRLLHFFAATAVEKNSGGRKLAKPIFFPLKLLWQGRIGESQTCLSVSLRYLATMYCPSLVIPEKVIEEVLIAVG
jgi:hypothetical protein